MTLSDQLTERIKFLEGQHTEIVKSIYFHEVELGVEKNQKRLLAKQIAVCKGDLEKISEGKQ